MSIFETLREQVPLHQLVEKDSGKRHCVSPAHSDTNPSMQVYTDHVHCFSCGFHGDVVDVWAAKHGFERPIEAAMELAREFGIELPELSPEAQRKTQERRRKEDLYLQQARACHQSLEIHTHVCGWWEGRGFSGEHLERFLLGTNKDGMSAVIPFWYRGRVQGLIQRKLEGEPKKYLLPQTRDFSDGYRPLFIPGPVHRSMFLVEGYVDALAIAALGEGAIAIGGTNISRTQAQELKLLSGPLYILPDADEEGQRAARKWVRNLYPKALLCPAEYGEDVRDG